MRAIITYLAVGESAEEAIKETYGDFGQWLSPPIVAKDLACHADTVLVGNRCAKCIGDRLARTAAAMEAGREGR